MDDTAANGASSYCYSRRDTEPTENHRFQATEGKRRKRLSLFARPTSLASKRSTPSLHAAMLIQHSAAADPPDPLCAPPRTSSSHTEGRRRTGDKLESIRNSLFRSRKTANFSGLEFASRPSSQQSGKQSRYSRSIDIFEKDEIPAHFMQRAVSPKASPKKPKRGFFGPKEGRRAAPVADAHSDSQRLRKSSISSPFNFQHVTHTGKEHLSCLDIVEEKDPVAHIGVVGAPQLRQHRLHEIRVDDLNNDLRKSLAESDFGFDPSDGPAERSHPLLSHSTRQDVDETTSEGTIEMQCNQAAALHSSDHAAMTAPRSFTSAPKHHSPLAWIGSPSLNLGQRQLRRQHSSDDQDCSPIEAAPEATPIHRLQQPVSTIEKAIPAIPPQQPHGQKVKEKQPLPPVPQKVSKNDSEALMELETCSSAFPGRHDVQSECIASTRPNRSSESAGPLCSSNAFSSKWTDVLEESTWEDDIDFAYEQAAEGRCDFNWEAASSPLKEEHEAPGFSQVSEKDSIKSGVSLSAWYDRSAALRPTLSVSNFQSTFGVESSMSTANHHRRGSSVGHKGFAAARSASNDGASRNSPSLSLDMACGRAGTPPHIIKLSGTDMGKLPSAGPSPESSYRAFDAVPEYLSDPESARPGGAKYRKSSSFESITSSGRSLQTSSDAARWSSGSSNSTPDPLQSNRKSLPGRRESRTSRRFESAPHNPNYLTDKQRLSIPQPAPAELSETECIVMRRPETRGDRELLFSAGRTVQRGRSAAPNRLHVRASPERVPESAWI